MALTDPEARINELEAELEKVKTVAVHMMTGICFGIAHTPQGLTELANGMIAPGNDPDLVIADLSRRLEVQLRDAAEKVQGSVAPFA